MVGMCYSTVVSCHLVIYEQLLRLLRLLFPAWFPFCCSSVSHSCKLPWPCSTMPQIAVRGQLAYVGFKFVRISIIYHHRSVHTHVVRLKSERELWQTAHLQVLVQSQRRARWQEAATHSVSAPAVVAVGIGYADSMGSVWGRSAHCQSCQYSLYLRSKPVGHHPPF